jgi:hypothetical protein
VLTTKKSLGLAALRSDCCWPRIATSATLSDLSRAGPKAWCICAMAAGHEDNWTKRFVELIQREGEQLYGSFVVMQPGRARISRLPDT